MHHVLFVMCFVSYMDVMWHRCSASKHETKHLDSHSFKKMLNKVRWESIISLVITSNAVILKSTLPEVWSSLNDFMRPLMHICTSTALYGSVHIPYGSSEIWMRCRG
jgi:hypothetical protein